MRTWLLSWAESGSRFMRKCLVARVYIEQATISFDKPFDYAVPFDLAEEICPGQRVLVPFGRANKKRQGMVVQVLQRDQSEIEIIKPILSILDATPVLTDEMLKLAEFMRDHTFCTYFEAIRPMLPAGINMQIIASYRYAPKADRLPVSKLNADAQTMVAYLKNSGACVKRERLLEIMGLQPDSTLPDELVKQGFLIRTDDAVRRVGDATVRMVRLHPLYDPDAAGKLTAKQRAVVEFLSDCETASVKEVCYFTGVTQAVVTTLCKKEILIYYENAVYRSPYQEDIQQQTLPIQLTEEQQAAYDGLLQQYEQADTNNTALLYGVTGSGKTQVFLKLIDRVMEQGRGVIVMVPEIALTPQTMQIFRTRYGSDVAIFHSAMSLGQRTDEWKRIKNGDAKIAVGTRSAVFAPFSDIGLIIMDEEQEHTYKSESAPRFHARDIARFRCGYHKGLLVLASATPSVESFSLAKAGKYALYELKHRYGNARLPQVQTVNMREQYADGNFSIFSPALIEALEQAYNNGKQSILLLNRRGYHVFVTCRSCGQVKTCPHCSISLTYHSANDRLMCHYCGYSEPYSDVCSNCGEKQIKLSGYGTQKAQEELQRCFPGARILRMDADTTMTRFAHEKGLNAFAKGEYDLMIGTQMVAKGLNFPRVTVVGVINADQSLYSNDFRSAEKTFSLLTQVIGRSGRADDAGIAVVQTITPENAIIALAAKQDYSQFYETEILSRKLMVYPPYCDLLVCGFVCENRDRVRLAATYFFEMLKNQLDGRYQDQKMIILGPSPCAVPKVSSRYRYRLILKCKNNQQLRGLLRGLLIQISKDYKDVTAFVDVNPENML